MDDIILRPWKLLVLGMAGLINQEQQQIVEYLQMENKILKEIIGKKRILLSANQKKRLGIKAKTLGRSLLKDIGTIFTPDTLLRWHRQLVAKKWDYNSRRKKLGRPPITKANIKLVLRFAKDNPTWGYDRISGALENLKIIVSPTKVGEILRVHGIEPAPERRKSTSWKTFISSHMECLGAMDFTTLEVWTTRGLVTYHLLFVMKIRSREVHFAGMTTNPNGAWVEQIGRNLTDHFDGFLKDGVKYLIMDRDPNFSKYFRKMISNEGIEVKRLPPKSPNLNSFQERFIGTVKQECLSRIIPIGERSVRYAVETFLSHYHHERNHQGLNNKLIFPAKETCRNIGAICRREGLGGLLNYYYRRAA